MNADDVYAKCNVCGIDLATPQDASEHGRATMTPTGATDGVTARGHGWCVINPTPQEKAERVVNRVVDDAVERAMEDLDREIDRGRVTSEQVTEALRWYPDFADAWRDWCAEADR